MARAEGGEMPVARTAEGEAGLAAIRLDPGAALIATDFDGTLAPIVADPREARADPGAVAGLRGGAGGARGGGGGWGGGGGGGGTLAVITGRPAAEAVELGGFEVVPGLIVL